jgi:hypothetical protein
MNWEPVTTALVGLIVAIITTFIPMAIKLFFEAWKAKLEKAKELEEKYQDIANSAVLLVQQTMNTLTNAEKYVEALRIISVKLNLPPDTLPELIETSVAIFKLEWGAAWEKLGGKDDAPTLPPPDGTIV